MTRHPADMAHRPAPDPTPLELLLGSLVGFAILLALVIAFPLLAPA